MADGRDGAQGALLDAVYAQLHVIARKFISQERPDHTLQATALIHEAYMRMLGSDHHPAASSNGANNGDKPVSWSDRGHFYRAAAEAMRRILVEHARRRGAIKRGGSVKRTLLNVCELAADDDPAEIMAIDEAISRLEESDPASAEVVRLRFFAGLSLEQTAAALGISERSVRREWTYARAKLFRTLQRLETE